MLPASFSRMGVATFFNLSRVNVTEVVINEENLRPSLRQRIQQFIVTPIDGGNALRVFNMHLPYDLAKSSDPSALIQFAKGLFNHHKSMPVLAMGDFNVYPKRIAKGLKGIHAYIQTDNNILIRADKRGAITHTESDTVDSIIQSLGRNGYDREYLDADTLPFQGVSPHLEHGFFGKYPLVTSTKKNTQALVPRFQA